MRSDARQRVAQLVEIAGAIARALQEEHGGHDPVEIVGLDVLGLVLRMQREAHVEEAVDDARGPRRGARSRVAPEADAAQEDVSGRGGRVAPERRDRAAQRVVEHLGRVRAGALAGLGERKVEAQGEVAPLGQLLVELL